MHTMAQWTHPRLLQMMWVLHFATHAVAVRSASTSTSTSNSASSALQQDIDRAIASGLPNQVVRASGEYDFAPGVSLTITGATKLTVIGHWLGAAGRGSSLYFHCGAGVHIANSSDVRFQGFVIDYRQPCFAQGKVVRAPYLLPASSRAASQDPAPMSLRPPPRPAGTNEYVDVEFDEAHFLAPEYAVALAANGSVKITFWDQETLGTIAHGNHLFNNISKTSSAGTTTTYRLGYSGCVSPVGVVQPGAALATLHPRLGLANGTGVAGGLTYLVTNASRVHTINVTLHGGATEAVVEGGGEGNHTYQNIRIVRPTLVWDPRRLVCNKNNELPEAKPSCVTRLSISLSHTHALSLSFFFSFFLQVRRNGQRPVRLLAANADGFHSSCVRIGPKLLDSEISFTGDDVLNIHSRLSIVLQPLTATSAYMIDTEGSSSPADYDESTLMLQQTRVGDTIAFSELGSLAANGSAVVQDLARVYDPAVVAAAVAAFSEINQLEVSLAARKNSQRSTHNQRDCYGMSWLNAEPSWPLFWLGTTADWHPMTFLPCVACCSTLGTRLGLACGS